MLDGLLFRGVKFCHKPSPSHHHKFEGGYVYQSQSWLVYDIVLSQRHVHQQSYPTQLTKVPSLTTVLDFTLVMLCHVHQLTHLYKTPIPTHGPSSLAPPETRPESLPRSPGRANQSGRWPGCCGGCWSDCWISWAAKKRRGHAKAEGFP